jgi:hypothetical protein
MNNENATLCGACEGYCCNSYPGGTVPEDWGAPDREVMRGRLLEAFGSGKWAIDWWEGDPRDNVDFGVSLKDQLSMAYYVRPATTDIAVPLFDPTHGKPCIMLDKNGCTLEHDDRPAQCRDLVPSENYPEECRGPASTTKQGCCIQWIPYGPWLRDLGDEFLQKGGSARG